MTHRDTATEGSGETLAAVVAETWTALLTPRRLLPSIMVALPLIFAQVRFSDQPLAGLPAVLICIAFFACGPAAYRALLGDRHRSMALGLRTAVYLGLSTVAVTSFSIGLPRALGLGATFLGDPTSVTISVALFVVGGFGLGRDVDLELRLERSRSRMQELERHAERAELLALRAHLDPHFLFNTLNAIAEWCREDGAVAEKAILQLSSLLRTVLAGARRASWPVQREIELLHAFFDLHHIRDPDLYTMEWQLPDDLEGIELPPLLLLPLAENAMKHGPGSGHRGRVRVAIEIDDDYLSIAIDNPGPFGGRRADGEGIAMVERRVALAYDAEAILEIGPTSERHQEGSRGSDAVDGPGDEDRTRAHLRIPRKFPRPKANV